MAEEEQYKKESKESANCQEKETNKKISISDAFLSKAIYTKNPTYYKNMYMDRANTAGAQAIPSPLFSEPSSFNSGSPMQRGRHKQSRESFSPLNGRNNGSYLNERNVNSASPEKMQTSRDYHFDNSLAASSASPSKNKTLFAAEGAAKKGAPAATSSVFAGAEAGDLWDKTKRIGSLYADDSATAPAHASGDAQSSSHTIQYDNTADQSAFSSSTGTPSNQPGLHISTSHQSKAYAAKQSPMLLGMNGSAPEMGVPRASSFSPIDPGSHLSGGSFLGCGISAVSINNAERGFFESPSVINVYSSSGSSLNGGCIEIPPCTVYNPLENSAYESSQISQLKHTAILSSAILPLIDFTADSIAQQLRLNEILGLPRIQPHHTALTKSILNVTISNGGLQVVDKKNMWGEIASQLGQKSDDAHRLRMYYIIVCYPYEQVLYLHNNRLSTVNQTILIVYIDPKKTDMLPEIINLLSKKKKTETKAGKCAKVVETSGILEVVVVLNEMYINGAKTSQDLLEMLGHLEKLTCTESEAKDLFSCQELSLIEQQVRSIMIEWISKRVEEISSKDIGIEKEIIEIYEEYLARRLARTNAIDKEQKNTGEKRTDIEQKTCEYSGIQDSILGAQKSSTDTNDGDALVETTTQKPSKSTSNEAVDAKEKDSSRANTSDEKDEGVHAGKDDRMCAKSYNECHERYAYPFINIKDRSEKTSSTCGKHRECRLYRRIMCACRQTVLRFDTAAEIYYSVLLFLGKSTSLHVSDTTIPLLLKILEKLPSEVISFKYRYIYKFLLAVWNILKEKKTQGPSLCAGALLDNSYFLKVAEEVGKLLNSSVLSKSDILSIVSNGELELIMKISNTSGGFIILSRVRTKRLAEIWRYLLYLVCDGFFSRSFEMFQETALASLDSLSLYLQKHLVDSDVIRDAVCAVGLQDGQWIIDALSCDMVADSVYSLCDFLLSAHQSL